MPIQQITLREDEEQVVRPFIRVAGIKEGEEFEAFKKVTHEIADEMGEKVFVAVRSKCLEIQFARDTETTSSDGAVMRNILMGVMRRHDA